MGQGNDPRSQANLAQLRDALRDLGWTDGHNLHLEVRWAAGEMDRSMSSVTRSCGSEPVLSPWILPFMRSSYWHLADMVIALSNVRFWA